MTIRPILDFIFEEKAGVWSSKKGLLYIFYQETLKLVAVKLGATKEEASKEMGEVMDLMEKLANLTRKHLVLSDFPWLGDNQQMDVPSYVSRKLTVAPSALNKVGDLGKEYPEVKTKVLKNHLSGSVTSLIKIQSVIFNYASSSTLHPCRTLSGSVEVSNEHSFEVCKLVKNKLAEQ